MQTKLWIIIATVVLLAVAVPAAAHHSFAAEFDAGRPITVKGTVTKMDWVNPHSWIYVDVKDQSGKVVNWRFEMAPRTRSCGWAGGRTRFLPAHPLRFRAIALRPESPSQTPSKSNFPTVANCFLAVRLQRFPELQSRNSS